MGANDRGACIFAMKGSEEAGLSLCLKLPRVRLGSGLYNSMVPCSSELASPTRC